jgi:hypothetical protein
MAALLGGLVDEATAVIEALAPDRLCEHLVVQSYHVTVLEAIYHVVEHFSGHTGQIVYATKLLTGDNLEYYRHLKTTAAHAEQTP